MLPVETNLYLKKWFWAAGAALLFFSSVVWLQSAEICKYLAGCSLALSKAAGAKVRYYGCRLIDSRRRL